MAVYTAGKAALMRLRVQNRIHQLDQMKPEVAYHKLTEYWELFLQVQNHYSIAEGWQKKVEIHAMFESIEERSNAEEKLITTSYLVSLHDVPDAYKNQ